ncbi:MAG: SHOCT domain-containing protein [Candidatus Nitrosopolaris sp.]
MYLLEENSGHSDVQKQLLEREKVLLHITQSRLGPGSSTINPHSLYITNMRIIYRKPTWGGLKSDIIDVNYQDMADIRLKRGIIHTDISLKSRFHTDEITLTGISNDIAEKANALIQQGIRGEHIGQGMYRQPQQAPPNYNYDLAETQVDEDAQSNIDPLDRLAKLVELKQKGALTEEEFQKLKSRIVSKL